MQVEPVEHGHPGVAQLTALRRQVGEADLFEPQLAVARRQRLPVGPVDDGGVGGENLVDARGRGHGPLGHGDDRPQHAQRRDEHEDVGHEGDELAHAQVAAEHLVASVPQHGHQAQRRQEVQQGHERRPHAPEKHGALEHPVDPRPQLAPLDRLGP